MIVIIYHQHGHKVSLNTHNIINHQLLCRAYFVTSKDEKNKAFKNITSLVKPYVVYRVNKHFFK